MNPGWLSAKDCDIDEFVALVETDVTLADYPAAALNIPRIGGHSNFSVESIVAYQPDLVVVWSGGHSQATIQQLDALKLKTFHINADYTAAIRNYKKVVQLNLAPSLADVCLKYLTKQREELRSDKKVDPLIASTQNKLDRQRFYVQ